MRRRNMEVVRGAQDNPGRGVRRGRTVSGAVQAIDRRPLSPRGGGRAWINGREVGGADRRWTHLEASHD
jgi:hypothetical protein